MPVFQWNWQVNISSFDPFITGNELAEAYQY